MKKRNYLAIGGVVAAAILVVAVSIDIGGSNNNKEAQKDNSSDAPDLEEVIQDVPADVPEHKDNKPDLTEKAVKNSREVARTFAAHYVTLNPKKPNAYIEKTKNIVTDDLYQKISTSQRRPTAMVESRNVVSLESYPVDDVLMDRKKWNVIAVANVTNSEGKTTKKEISLWLSVVKENGNWKVSGFDTNV